jgi:serine/threonine protein kinase/Flp pilus assembly protein TadD
MTTPQRWQEIDRIFAAALEHEPAERAAFLDEACGGDQQLRKEVESLLAHDIPESLVRGYAVEEATQLLGNRVGQITGERIGRYRIVRHLGGGGMGQVYLGRDEQLNRPVAVKLLSQYHASEQERMQRFRQEALSASALNHPNILTIYEIGEFESHNFIAAEFVDGVTLSARMKASELPVQLSLDIAIQIARALSAAHAAGIIHRDIKPDNVMIRADGLVKVLDFGIAKFEQSDVQEKRDQVQTMPGTIVGTVAYMSPEQARGGSLDARTDIWSLGVILYEMVARQRPFSGDTPADLIAALIERQPPPLSAARPVVSDSLERIVFKALQKDRKARYQTANELLADLKELQQKLERQNEPEQSASNSQSAASGIDSVPAEPRTDSALPQRTLGDDRKTTSKVEYVVGRIKHHKYAILVTFLTLIIAAVGFLIYRSRLPKNIPQIESIAVMPFVNASGNSEVEYLSDGMTDTLITSLSQLPQLSVKARSSVFRYKGKDIAPQQVGKELNVQAILSGRLVQRGNDLTLHVELVDVKTETALWSGDYSRSMTNLAALEGEIARDVSQKLRTRLSGAEEQKLTKNYTENAEAYQLYLKGRYEWNKHTLESLQKGVEYFNQAIELDPNYALAYVGLSISYGVLGNNYLPPNEAFPKAKAYAAKALAIDDTLSEAHVAMAAVNLFYDWDWAEAERHLKRAQTLNPNDATVNDIYGAYWEVMGRSDKAVAESKRGQELDPLSLMMNTNLGIDLYYSRRYDEAIAQLEKTVNLEPRYYNAYLYLGQAYEQKKIYQQAIATFQKGLAQSERHPKLLASLGHAYALSGERDKANKVLDEMREMSKRRYVSPYLFAVVYVGLGDKDQAFAWLEKAYQDRSVLLIWLRVEPLFDSLRDDPRFAELLRRVGLSQ